jgi:hypothetical protein
MIKVKALTGKEIEVNMDGTDKIFVGNPSAQVTEEEVRRK